MSFVHFSSKTPVERKAIRSALLWAILTVAIVAPPTWIVFFIVGIFVGGGTLGGYGAAPQTLGGLHTVAIYGLFFGWLYGLWSIGNRVGRRRYRRRLALLTRQGPTGARRSR